jgi:poly-gamma-glutamate synthesis protein (capsule biosynthesis protein)
VELAGIDVVYGHSSHHVKAIEVFWGRPILYGCGDFLDDYEGISGYEEFRGDLGLLYFVTLDRATGSLARLRMTPTRVSRFQVRRAHGDDTAWLARTLSREGRRFHTSVHEVDGRLELRWGSRSSRESPP